MEKGVAEGVEEEGQRPIRPQEVRERSCAKLATWAYTGHSATLAARGAGGGGYESRLPAGCEVAFLIWEGGAQNSPRK